MSANKPAARRKEPIAEFSARDANSPKPERNMPESPSADKLSESGPMARIRRAFGSLGYWLSALFQPASHMGPGGAFYSAEMALIHAARIGDADQVALLANARRARHTEPGAGKDALMSAAGAGQLECVRLLLACSDAMAKDFEGRSALMLAAQAGHAECAALLLPASDACAVNRDGMSAFMLALSRGRAECAKALLPHSSLLQANSMGRTALMLAAAAPGEQADALELALSTPAGLAALFARDAEGRTALAHAVAEGHAGRAERLLAAAGCGEDARLAGTPDQFGMTPLMLAAASRSLACVNAVLPLSDASATDARGRTALSWAAELSPLECVKAIAAVSEIGAVELDGRALIARALETPNREKIADWLAANAKPGVRAAAVRAFGAEKLPQAAAMMEAAELRRSMGLSPFPASPSPVLLGSGAGAESGAQTPQGRAGDESACPSRNGGPQSTPAPRRKARSL